MLIRQCWSLFFLLGFVLAPASGQQSGCADVQKRLDRVYVSGYQLSHDASWNDLEPLFGKPARTTQDSSATTFHYDFTGCSVGFRIGSKGKVITKAFKFASIIPTSSSAASVATREDDHAGSGTVGRLEAAIQRLEVRLSQVEQALAKTGSSSSNTTRSIVAAAPLLELPPSLSLDSGLPTTKWSTASPSCTESGSCYGDISPATGSPKTVHVNGYYRKDGTYVRPHYRSPPRR